MTTSKTLNLTSKGFIVLSTLSLLTVSLMAVLNPQSVMDLVSVKLNNNDAFSSIRGVYGGVGFTIVISLLYLLVKDFRKGLAFLAMFWGFYAVSRLITVLSEGALGGFGNQWMLIETVFFIIASTLLFLNRHKEG